MLKHGAAALNAELADLNALTPPTDEAVVYHWGSTPGPQEFATLHAATAKLDQGVGPVGTFRELQDRLAPLETDADYAWRALGIPACLGGQ